MSELSSGSAYGSDPGYILDRSGQPCTRFPYYWRKLNLYAKSKWISTVASTWIQCSNESLYWSQRLRYFRPSLQLRCPPNTQRALAGPFIGLDPMLLGLLPYLGCGCRHHGAGVPVPVVCLFMFVTTQA
ncbi:hypothetical protein PIB30_070082 [Stylosanthes scabra]|uniref:Uncharacterized protein n=1 Tax=Stylosanthes scabra TaxID=79078 RepID=A0ABU6YL05_9FABA|nr:hypothetical protein [Stylosanthes scabra]